MVYCNFKHIMVITLAFLYAQPTSSRLNQQRLGPGPECTAVKEADRTCYNGNKVYIAAFTANKMAHDGTMGHTYAVAWGDHEWCQELVARLPEAENEEKFRTACVGIFGNDCCTQCRTIGREGERESFAKALREIKTAGPASAKAQIQNFITAQSRQVMLCKQQIREYERRHEVSARAWSELEQEKESLAAEVDFLRKEALEQAVSWRDMLSARDKRLVYLEDKLATLAGYGSSAKKAAAQVLVRELHDMRRETADFLDRLQRRVDTQQISPSKQQNSKNNKTGTTTTTSSSGRARETVMESRVTTLQNELRQ